MVPPITLHPIPGHKGSSAGLYTSVAFNIFFGSLFGFGIFYVIRSRIRKNRGRRLSSHSIESGVNRDLQHFSIDESEARPLLSGRPNNSTEQASTEEARIEQARTQHNTLLRRLQNFHWSFGTRSWVETRPESNEPIARAQPATTEAQEPEGHQFTPSAPALVTSAEIHQF